MGNRGCLHDAERRIRRAFAGRRWIICVLQFKGRRRAIMTPGRYTELFFLDEATALSAGHRPCVECQRERYRLFRHHWQAASPSPASGAPPSADALDAVLHAERLDTARAKRTYAAPASRLPSGTMIADADGRAALVWRDVLLPWGPGGYGEPIGRRPDATVTVLTPPSIVGALAHGYPVEVHASARALT
jgi:hypothetical protein